MADDFGWANAGWHNPEHTKTPHLNDLVRKGIELDRHYIYWFCAPSRASFLSGRLPIHVNEDFDDCSPEGTIPRNMTTIADKLKQAGYATHQVGKWGVGQASHRSIPTARGFDTSFGYFGSQEDHYTHRNGGCGCDSSGCAKACEDYNDTALPLWNTDLWESDRPAGAEWKGMYAAMMYDEHVAQIIAKHDPAAPLFLYLAAQDCHGPDQGDRWADLFSDYVPAYAQYNGMASALDSMVGNLTARLIAKAMWSKTLMVFSSDNGGPTELGTETNASNYPLRGGKASAFEGGHRVAAFVSGGVVPQAVRGRVLDGYIHVADWYPTFCGLAGVSAEDAPKGLPAVDGMNMWPYVSGGAAASPRTELALSSVHAGLGRAPVNSGGAALIVGDWKLLRPPGPHANQQNIVGGCDWTGPVYPNETSHPPPLSQHCVIPAEGWLFNVRTDPSERFDMSARHPDVKARLLKRAKEIDATQINFVKGDGWRGEPDQDAACKQAISQGGVWGPHLP